MRGVCDVVGVVDVEDGRLLFELFLEVFLVDEGVGEIVVGEKVRVVFGVFWVYVVYDLCLLVCSFDVVVVGVGWVCGRGV